MATRPLDAPAPEHASRLELIPKVAGSIVAGLALVVLSGWALGIPVLTGFVPGLAGMNPTSAVAFLLASAALVLLTSKAPSRPGAGRALAALVLALGLLRLAEVFLGWTLGVDQVLFRASLAEPGAPLNHMAPSSALDFAVLAGALLLLDVETRFGWRPAQSLALVGTLVPLVALTGYAYEAEAVGRFATWVPMPLSAAAAFFALAVGILAARPGVGITSVLASPHAGGTTARRLAPMILIVLLALGWVRLQGQQMGLYGTEFGATMHTVLGILILEVVVWVTARRLDRLDVQRKEREEETSRLVRELARSNDELVLRRRQEEDARQGAERARQEAEEARGAAEAASRSKSDFLAKMSHEIRTPMNGVQGMLELLLDTPLAREQREYVGLAKSSAEALLTVINDILDFSKIEAGRLELFPEDLDVAETIADTVGPLAHRAQQKGIELAWEVGPDVPRKVVGDAGRLRQILINLVGNAVKFTQRGEIVVLVERASVAQPDALHFSVRDTGVGIDPEQHARIFEAFEQADGSITRTFGGTGLGLAISAQLVRLMGGAIWVESMPGEGSTFHFTARLPPAKAGRSQGPGPLELRDAPTLIVDDNETSLVILDALLAGWGLGPSLARNRAEALAALERARSDDRPFRVVLVDSRMPDSDGFELAREILAHPAAEGARLVMLTSSDSPDDPVRSRELGVFHLPKPVRPSDLLDYLMSPAERDEVQRIATGPAAPGAALDVLVAEDHPVNQKLAVRLLEKNGHRVTIAPTGGEAVRQARTGRFDVILMDVQMPDMDGLEATRAIRREEALRGGRTPIFALTAHALESDRERCLEAGMDGYLTKPIRSGDLFRALADVARARPGDEATVTRDPAGGAWPTGDEGEPPGEAPLPAGTAPEPAVFDAEAALERAMGDPALLVEVLGIFLEDSGATLQGAGRALAEGDADALARAAHALKGAAANLSAEAVREAAAHVEALAERGDLEAAAEATDVLTTRMTELRGTLVAFLARATPLEETLP